MPENTNDFHDVRFPLHLAFGTRGGPVRPTEILQFVNGSETRNAKTRHSRRQYNAIAGLKSREQAIELLNFYESKNGPLYGFRFRDPLDNSADNPIGIGDGAQRDFELMYGLLQNLLKTRLESLLMTLRGLYLSTINMEACICRLSTRDNSISNPAKCRRNHSRRIRI